MGLIKPVEMIWRSKRDVSPLMIVDIDSDIAPLETKAINLEKEPYSKYLPFNYIYISNKSNSTILLIINGTIKKKIEGGTVEIFDSEIIPAIWSIAIQNLDSVNTISKDDIEIAIQKQKTIKMVLDNLVLRF